MTYHRNDVLKFQKKRCMAMNLYKEDLGCMNHACWWRGKYDSAMLDFHHIDPNTKAFNVSRLIMSSDDIINQEISKCILICANCHRCVKTIDINNCKRCPEFKFHDYLNRLPLDYISRKNYTRNSKYGLMTLGVTYHKRSKKWQVVIKGKYLGQYSTKIKVSKIAKSTYDKLNEKMTTLHK